MITVAIVGLNEVAARIQAMPAIVQSRLTAALVEIGVMFTAYVKGNKLSGQVLKNQSGLLRRSVNYEVHNEGNIQYVEVGTRGVPYAAIHEYGGTINIPEIKPVNARALHWVSGGQDVFAMSARAHTVTMPERSYLRSSLTELRPEITTRLQTALQGLWNPL